MHEPAEPGRGVGHEVGDHRHDVRGVHDDAQRNAGDEPGRSSGSHNHG